MKRSQRLRAASALSCAVTCAQVPAGAQSPAPPGQASLVFEAPEGCGSADEFAARVRRRSTRIQLVEQRLAPRTLGVRIEPIEAGAALRGRVTLVEPDGTTRERQLKAGTCEEALEGLALIATVTLDPDALSAEPEPEPPSPPQPPPPAPPPSRPRRAPVSAPAAPAPSYRLSFGLAGTVLVDVAPEPAFGAQANAALELRPGHVLAPLLRLSVAHAQRRELALAGGQASFAYTLPTLDVCPLRFGPAALGVRPCAFVNAGSVKAWGSGGERDETHLRFFGSAGPALLLGFRAGKVIEIIADARAGVALTRDSFGFDGVPAFTTPALGFSSALGVAGGFP